MRAVVLGAGASKAYSQSPTGQKMPVARDFFQTFDALAISSNPWVLQEGLATYLMRAGVDDIHGYLRSGVDIEQLHTEIEETRALAMAEAGDDFFKFAIENRAYTELLFIFASVVNEIQNGPISTPHRKLARRLSQNDVVITFNWDTLMDRALAAESGWRIEEGYGVAPFRVFRDGWKVPATGQPSPSPRILKLHGSTNWITAYPMIEGGRTILTHELDPATLHVFESASEPYPCYAGRYMNGYEPFSYGYYPPNLLDVPGKAAPKGYAILSVRPRVPWKPEGGATSEGLVSSPLIIPPVRQKTYEVFGGLFSSLWASAEDALSAVDDVVVIGYSFPRTDKMTRELFTRAFMRRATMPRVTIVDPNPTGIAHRFADEFGIAGDHLRV